MSAQPRAFLHRSMKLPSIATGQGKHPFSKNYVNHRQSPSVLPFDVKIA